MGSKVKSERHHGKELIELNLGIVDTLRCNVDAAYLRCSSRVCCLNSLQSPHHAKSNAIPTETQGRTAPIPAHPRLGLFEVRRKVGRE